MARLTRTHPQDGTPDDEVRARIAELSGVTVEEVKAWIPEELRRRADESRAALSEAEATEYDNG
jgi:hypothetical protein